MRTQQVLLGELIIDDESRIEVRASVSSAELARKVAVLKDRLAYLLDTRFRPADVEPEKRYRLTVEEVAESLHCRCRTVLKLIRRGELHPIVDDDGELYFDPCQVAKVTHVGIRPKLSRLVPRK